MGRNLAILVAAGEGKRMGRKKQFLFIRGKPLIAYTIQPFEDSSLVDGIILVGPKEDLGFIHNQVVEKYGFKTVEKIVPGGKRRQDSVYEGLLALEGNCDLVIVHDGARPLITTKLLEQSILLCQKFKAVVTAVRITDTVKREEGGFISHTLDRGLLWAAQTPQTFAYQLILRAYQKAFKDGYLASDDSALVERIGQRIKIMEGSYDNLKLTTPEDIPLLEALLRKRGKSL
jgi:2-C-methyl-D-erythritol 4-phosphate cytidylyltransferase